MKQIHCKSDFLRLVVLAFLFPCALGINAQTISLDLPAHKERGVTVLLHQGTRRDTLYSGSLDGKGLALIRIPDTYKDYRGMAVLRPDHPGAQFEFVLAGEDLTIRCQEEYPHGGNVVFENSPENESLRKWFYGQTLRQQKIALLSELSLLYKEEEEKEKHRLISEEKTNLESELTSLEKEWKKSPLYAARLMELRNLLDRRVTPLAMADSTQMVEVRGFVRDSLDIDLLFPSGMWFGILNGLLPIYDKNTPFHGEFIGDMSHLLRRAQTDKVYKALAENLLDICESMGWQAQEEDLASSLINDGRIKEPTGRLKTLMTLFKLSKGSEAPALTQGGLPPGKVLLVFYETGCSNCERELKELRDNYKELKADGYEVVSVAADTDLEVFQKTAETLPWVCKYRDPGGLGGEDFTNYGVIGTPTIYVIDEEGRVQGRHARLKEVGD